MKIRVELETIEGGRVVRRTVPLPPPTFPTIVYLRRVMVVCEDGVLASIPLTMESGESWPPLPFFDWSNVSAAYQARVLERARAREAAEDLES